MFHKKAAKKNVEEIMTRDPACLMGSDTLQSAAQLMRDCDCGAIPVVDTLRDRHPRGIITDRDITIRAVAGNRIPAESKVEEFMSSELATVSPDANLREVEATMEKHKVRRVLVVDKANSVCGIVTQAQLARNAPAEDVAEVLAAISEP